MRLRLAAAYEPAADREHGEGVIVYIRVTRGEASACVTSSRRTSCRTRDSTPSRPTRSSGFPVDLRDYGNGAQILVDLGITTMRFHDELAHQGRRHRGYGLKIVERVPLQTRPTAENLGYLRAKRDKLGHSLDLDLVDFEGGE